MPKNKKPITLDDLARLVSEGFQDTATKSELRTLSDESRRDKERILRAVEGLELKISAYASSWKQDFDRLHAWVKELEDRLAFIEKQGE